MMEKDLLRDLREIKVWDLLEKIGKNKTILFVSQDFNEVEKFADRISILHKGDIKIVAQMLRNLEKNAEKYPVEKAKGSNKKYDELK